jgi:hypothetical protein
MSKNPRWVSIWLVISAIWAAVAIASTARLMLTHPSFQVAASEECPQLMLRPWPELERRLQRLDSHLFFKVVVWRDAKTRREIVLYRKGEQALSCDTLELRAKLLLAGADAGIIRPQIYLRFNILAMLIIFPSLVFAPLIYVFYLPFARKKIVS